MIRTPGATRSGTALLEDSAHAVDPMLPALRPSNLSAALASIDPLALATAPMVLPLLSLLAAEGPARRAVAVETSQALRHE